MPDSADIPSVDEFKLYQALVREKLGIHLPEQKRAMLGHRLLKRLRSLQIQGFLPYFQYINCPEHKQELKQALELVTTNETYFFREIKHFEYLRDEILAKRSRALVEPFRVWSAACSSGEEPYSIAMTLSAYCQGSWELLASDVNETVLAKARKGIYLDNRMSHMSDSMRRRFCRRGTEEFDGYLRVIPELRKRVSFMQFNLLNDMQGLGHFDLIFLRNVLIYFDEPSKEKIIKRIAMQLKPGGYLFTGHSESFHGMSDDLESIQPAILKRHD